MDTAAQKEGKGEMPARPSQPPRDDRPASVEPAGACPAMGITEAGYGPQGVHPQLGGGVRNPTGSEYITQHCRFR
jgi:hypothetical protein